MKKVILDFNPQSFGLQDHPKVKFTIQSVPLGIKILFLVHSALSDLGNKKYIHHERIYREGWQAKASLDNLDLSVGGIEAKLFTEKNQQQVITRYQNGDRLELTFSPLKPLIVFWGSRP